MTATRMAEGEHPLEHAVERARKRWPGIGCGTRELAAHLERTGAVCDLERFGDELHLACACCNLDSVALRVLDRDYLRKCSTTLGRLRAGADFQEEALQ